MMTRTAIDTFGTFLSALSLVCSGFGSGVLSADETDDWVDYGYFDGAADYGRFEFDYEFDHSYGEYAYSDYDDDPVSTLGPDRRNQYRMSQLESQGQQREGENGEWNLRYEGVIEAIRRTDLRSTRGGKEAHLLLDLRLNNGASRTVSLGTSRTGKQLKLAEGKRVRVYGRTARVGGIEILLANRIQVSGG